MSKRWEVDCLGDELLVRLPRQGWYIIQPESVRYRPAGVNDFDLPMTVEAFIGRVKQALEGGAEK